MKMTHPPLAAFVAALILAFGTTAAEAAPVAVGEAERFVPEEVVVKYEDDATVADRTRTQRSSGTGRAERLPGGVRKLEVLDGEPVAETVRELRGEPDVAYAVPNYIARASGFFPNDPGFGAGWAQVQWNFFGPASVNAPDAWELAHGAGAPGGRGALVALLDTGVAYRSRGRLRRAPDLQARGFARGYDFVGRDRFPYDRNGHGTHVAGTVAAGTNNGQGLTGLAYGARVMPVRVLNRDGAGDAVKIARGLRFAARRGADVINMSLEFDSAVRSSRQIPQIASAVRYARRRGALVTGAAGNQGFSSVAYPARTNGVVSVAASTEHACQAEYSNAGSRLDLTAPGGGGDATNRDNPADLANCKPGTGGRPILQQTFRRIGRPGAFGYPRDFEGTSMASGHLAATAALVIGTRRLGPSPSASALEAHLKATSRDLGPAGYDYRYGSGLVDAAAAIRR